MARRTTILRMRTDIHAQKSTAMIAARATRLITHFPTILLSRKFPVTDKADLKFKANGFGGNAVLFYFLPVEWQVCVLLYDLPSAGGAPS